MRARDIKEGTAYATCDGLYIKILSAKRAWAKNPKTGAVEQVAQPDPWGGCMKATKPAMIGLKAEFFDVDVNGDPIENKIRNIDVIDPRDVKGTWSEFLTFYADDIRKRVQKHDDEVQALAYIKRLETIFTAIGARITVSHTYKLLPTGRYGYTSKFDCARVIFDADSFERLHEIATFLDVILPDDTAERFESSA